MRNFSFSSGLNGISIFIFLSMRAFRSTSTDFPYLLLGITYPIILLCPALNRVQNFTMSSTLLGPAKNCVHIYPAKNCVHIYPKVHMFTYNHDNTSTFCGPLYNAALAKHICYRLKNPENNTHPFCHSSIDELSSVNVTNVNKNILSFLILNYVV